MSSDPATSGPHHELFLRMITDEIRDDRNDRNIIAKITSMLAAHLQVDNVELLEPTMLSSRDRTEWGSIDPGQEWRDDSAVAFALDDLNAGGIVAIDDWDQRRSDCRAFVAAPMIQDGKLMAVLIVRDHHARRWTNNEVDLIRDLADRTWSAVVRVRIEAALAERERNQAFLIDWSDAIRDERDPEKVIIETLARLDHAFNLLNVSFSELDETGTMLENVRYWQDGHAYKTPEASPISMLGPPLVAALLDKASVSVEDVFTDPRIPEDCHALYARYNVGALVLAPLVSQGRVVALLAMHFGGPRQWTKSEQQVLRDLADRVWSTLERTRAEIALARSREALSQSEKMASIGAVLAGISHELNNPLAVVTAQAELIAHMAQGTELAARAQKVHEAGDRCARIIRTFLAMARQAPPDRRLSSLSAIIRSATNQVLDAAAAAGIMVETNLDPTIPNAWVDPDQIHQIIVNLLINAQQAICRPGKLAGETGGRIHVTASWNEAQRQAMIDVIDDGPGIPPSDRLRIFEPFVTTKEVGQGTGMGLSLAQGLAELHGGALDLMPSDNGAWFRLSLPVSS